MLPLRLSERAKFFRLQVSSDGSTLTRRSRLQSTQTL
jgi:hypothetical protein